MKKNTIIWLVLIIVVIILGVWFFNSANGVPTTPTAPQTTTQVPATANAPLFTLSVSSSSALGAYLVAANGMTLYRYTKDAPGISNCSGQCATLWPPYTVASGTQLTANAFITGQIGTITRADGANQVTYNGKPLYFWSKDKIPGDTNGQNIGGIWFVVNP